MAGKIALYLVVIIYLIVLTYIFLLVTSEKFRNPISDTQIQGNTTPINGAVVETTNNP